MLIGIEFPNQRHSEEEMMIEAPVFRMAVFSCCQAMDDVVYAHNVTNEKSWKAVLDWEKLHSKSCPRLDEVVFDCQKHVDCAQRVNH